VTLTQACCFQRPLRLLQSYSVLTRVVCVDDRHAYISHRFESAWHVHAELLVKMKFKSGRLTVPAQRFFPHAATNRSPAIDALDSIEAQR
jgi:hypothetical protein